MILIYKQQPPKGNWINIDSMKKDCNKKIIARGFTILETVVAAAVLVFAAIGPMSVAYQSLIAHKEAKSSITAHYLAEEAIDLIYWLRFKNNMDGFGWLQHLIPDYALSSPFIIDGYYNPPRIRRTNSGPQYERSMSIYSNRLFICNDGNATNPTWIYRHNLSGTTLSCYSEQQAIPTKFFRYLRIRKDEGGTGLIVSAYVEWLGKTGALGGKVVLNSVLNNWRVNPNP